MDRAIRQALSGALEVGRRILDDLRAIDLRSYESRDADVAVRDMTDSESGAIQQLVRLIGDTLRMLTNLDQGLAEDSDDEDSDEPEEVDLDFDAWDDVTNGKAEPSHDNFLEELDTHIDVFLEGMGDDRSTLDQRQIDELRGTCGMLSMDLRQTRDRIQNMVGRGSKWGLITEGEEARRKSRQSLRAILMITGRALGHDNPDELVPEERSALECAMQVRSALLEFRREVLFATDDIDDLDEDLLVMVAERLAELIENLRAEPIYGEFRAPDRHQLSTLLERLDDEAKELFPVLQDFRAFAEMLTAVNNREVLTEHDRVIWQTAHETLKGLLGLLEISAAGAIAAYKQALDELGAMRWRSESLDHYLVTERKAPIESSDDLRWRIARTTAELETVKF